MNPPPVQQPYPQQAYMPPQMPMRMPSPADLMREKIRTQARAALTAGIIGCFIFGFVFGPGALIRAHIVRSNVAQYNVGHEHLSTARTATILGIVGLSLWTLMMLFAFRH
jgi:hypothetical protein